MGLLYKKDGKILAKEFLEIYIPKSYIDDGFAIDHGLSIQTTGLLYIRSYTGGKEGPLKTLNIPVIIDVMQYNYEMEEIDVKGKSLEVRTLKFIKDSCVIHGTIQMGKDVSEKFLNTLLSGKIPKTVDYSKLINIWWKNLEMAGTTFKIPSKMFELIIAVIYRSPKNIKERFGMVYGKQSNPDGYNYQTGNVVDAVEGQSTFSGIAFENFTRMVTSGVLNTRENREEIESPLEKIIYY